MKSDMDSVPGMMKNCQKLDGSEYEPECFIADGDSSLFLFNHWLTYDIKTFIFVIIIIHVVAFISGFLHHVVLMNLNRTKPKSGSVGSKFG